MAAGSDGGASSPRALPPRPNIEHLKNEAKAELRRLHEHAPKAKLTAAQLEVARAYGFSSWRALRAAVESRSGQGDPGDEICGWYRLDPKVIANVVVAVTRADGRLYLQQTGRPRMSLEPDGAGGFRVAGADVRYRFEGAPGEPARTLLIERASGRARAERADVDAAEAAQAAFARDLADQARPRTRVPIAPERLDLYVGTYASPLDLVMEVTRRGGSLFARAIGQSALEVVPEGGDRFFFTIAPAQIEFELGADRAEALVVHQNGYRTRALRVSEAEAGAAIEALERKLAEQERPRVPAPVAPQALGACVGVYQANATVRMTVSQDGERLFCQVVGQRRFEIFAESETEFFATVAAVQFSFLSGEDGRADRVVVHQNGRDILMMRAEGGGETS